MDFYKSEYFINKLVNFKKLSLSSEGVFLNAQIRGNDIVFSSVVFSDDSYIPSCVREYIEETKLEKYQTLSINEKAFQVLYFQKFVFSRAPVKFLWQVQTFCGNSKKWKSIFDDLSQQDLVFIHQK